MMAFSPTTAHAGAAHALARACAPEKTWRAMDAVRSLEGCRDRSGRRGWDVDGDSEAPCRTVAVCVHRGALHGLRHGACREDERPAGGRAGRRDGAVDSVVRGRAVDDGRGPCLEGGLVVGGDGEIARERQGRGGRVDDRDDEAAAAAVPGSVGRRAGDGGACACRKVSFPANQLIRRRRSGFWRSRRLGCGRLRR
jgi:hypothetical protein